MFSNKSGLEASQKRGGNKADSVVSVYILPPMYVTPLLPVLALPR